jgi:hypothetical protein
MTFETMIAAASSGPSLRSSADDAVTVVVGTEEGAKRIVYCVMS